MIKNSVHIVGGGVIGLCSAWYLKEAGFEVTVIDKNNFTDGASHGNAGMIVPSHFVPMATPGVIRQGLKWLLNSKSPFYVKPRFNKELIQWLWKFYQSANVNQVKDAMPVLFAFNEHSKKLYKQLSEEKGFDFSFEERGLLMLYKTRKQEEEEEQLAEKAHQMGIEAEVLNNCGLQELEPEMNFDVRGGIYFSGDAHLYPNQFISQMIFVLKQKGVLFLGNKEVSDFKIKGSKIEALIDTAGDFTPVKNILLCAGAWTSLLLKKIGIKLYLQDGKGYSITLKKPTIRPRIPTILSEAKVAITPMGEDLRIGGTLELSGLSDGISWNRVQGIIESIPVYYKNLKIPSSTLKTPWKGYRPCSPDGLPYIGKSKSFSNLIVGTGHGMMGMSLGPATGKLVSQLLMKEEQIVDPFLFRLDRF